MSVQPSLRDSFVGADDPALKRRAIFVCASGAKDRQNLRMLSVFNPCARARRGRSVAEKLFLIFRNGRSRFVLLNCVSNTYARIA